MTEYKRITSKKGKHLYKCGNCPAKEGCDGYFDCLDMTYRRLRELENLIEDGKLIFVDADDDEMVQIKVSRSWLKEMHRILHEKDIDC